MSCNCNNQPTNYNICNPAPCQEPQDCSCPTILKSDCVNYSGDDLECSNIKQGTILTELIQQLDAFICQVRDDLLNAFSLRNIGAGAKVYKGDDLLGRKELRTITKTGDLITVTENTDNIAVGIDEEALDTFIEANQKTYSVANVGTDPLRVNVYKDSTIIGDNTQFNFRTVVQENQGMGESFLRDIQQTTDELKVRVKTLVSDNLTITATDEEVRIETPSTASIPALYVNNLYVPTYQEWLAENSAQNGGVPILGFEYIGKGTLAQPFTDTIVYPLAGGSPTITPNTAIQNALDGDIIYSYVGSGTRLSPEKVGQKIKVQDNNTRYNFAGDFGYSRLNIEVNANIAHTGSGKLFDMDNAAHFNALQDSIIITIGEGYFVSSEGEGVYNSGSNIATNNLTQARTAVLKGKGTLYFPNNNITKYGINSDILGSGNNNDGNVTFLVECIVRSDYQGVYKIGGNSRIYVYGNLVSGVSSITINPMLKAFMHLGGQVRFFEGSEINFGSTTRTDGFVFTPTGGFTPGFIGNSPTIVSFTNITNLFNKTTTDNVIFTLINSQSGVFLNITNIFKSPNMWNVVFNNNVFESGFIDTTKADLTLGNLISVSNSIGASIIESLVSYTSRENARLAGLPTNSVFLIKKFVSADNLVAGAEYKVTTEGVPSLGTEGTYITATGSETGTGVGLYSERCVLI